jgi:hypothetical protein
VPEDSLWNRLGLAKHHGLPTRLLDWTFSPYVALHFATANAERFDVDGAIWCIDFVAANKRLPERLRRLLDEERANTLSAEMLDGAAPTLEAFDAPRVLFPGLHGLSRWLARYYAPSPGTAVTARDARASPHRAASEAEP